VLIPAGVKVMRASIRYGQRSGTIAEY
jgi:hypothetical protein